MNRYVGAAASGFVPDQLPSPRAPDPVYRWLAAMVERHASALHLLAGAPPTLRVADRMEALAEPPLTGERLGELLVPLLTSQQRDRFEESRQLDFCHTVPGLARFRLSLFRQRRTVGAVVRAFPPGIPPLGELGLPASVASFATARRGLVLVAGPSGSGVSTTQAAILGLANRLRAGHILTIEDPIEYRHRHGSCLVSQQEVGTDTAGFAADFPGVLRHDADVLAVGELAGPATIAAAVSAAEDNRLVIATMRTPTAAQTVERLVDAFLPHRQAQIRRRLAAALHGAVCQRLVQRADRSGPVVATEVLLATPSVRTLILEAKSEHLTSALAIGGAEGMHTVDQDLIALYRDGVITFEVALAACQHSAEFQRLAAVG